MIGAKRRRQCGEGLIPMMVGMVLTLLTVLAMLMAYRTMVAVSIPATRAALRDGQAASALLTAQIELQQAGYGVDSSVDGGANLIVDEAGRRIIWRFRERIEDASPRCAGLQLVTGTEENDGIYFLPPVDECDSADSPPAWAGASAPRLIASDAVLYAPDEDDESEGEVRAYDLSNAVFEITPGQDCGPFGIAGATPNRTLVTLRDAVRDVRVFSYCLTNT